MTTMNLLMNAKTTGAHPFGDPTNNSLTKQILLRPPNGVLNPCADMNFVDSTVCHDQSDDFMRENEVSSLAADLLMSYSYARCR